MAEKKYIEAAALLPMIPHINGETTMQCVERAIAHVPAADVVEVVRCKDCEHYCNKFEYCDFLGITCIGTDFCSNGERK